MHAYMYACMIKAYILYRLFSKEANIHILELLTNVCIDYIFLTICHLFMTDYQFF